MAELRPSEDPYRVLGIARGADSEQIKAAHRRLAKRYHPDAGGGDEQRFLAVQEAYQLLSDPLRRQEWDRRHAPGPVRAQTSAGSRPDSRPRQRTGTPRRRSAARPPRDARTRGYTWSAAGVPWWEDFRPRSGEGPTSDATAAPGSGRRSGRAGSTRRRAADDEAAGAAGRDEPTGTARPGARDETSAQHVTPEHDDTGRGSGAADLDVYSRSSGAAWSMAARRHFRRGDADLPSRGAWRYRGSQVVTGAEARKVAAREAAEAAARERAATTVRRGTSTARRPDAASTTGSPRSRPGDASGGPAPSASERLFRPGSRGRPGPRPPFDHDPTPSSPDPVPPAGPVPPGEPAPSPSKRSSIGATLADYLRSLRGGEGRSADRGRRDAERRER